ncbi:YXWGXW repeat-containing protein [Pelomonas sp. KK5]|uniref:YXWGXW repeat-containing protein n=1 Tax=Pelomonas sp. KK5 TaxID=1855730 RepID=UPI00097BF5A7|nr:YXWGXW repeat-containing protein [Pelomonas sp. KK5]
MSYRLPLLALAAISAAVSLSGCIVAPARGAYAYDGAVVTVAPPAPQVEYYGAPPTPGYIWLGGYWNWVGGRHVWVGGHWEAPRAGYHWVPHAWVHAGNGWRMEPGRWERHRHD